MCVRDLLRSQKKNISGSLLFKCACLNARGGRKRNELDYFAQHSSSSYRDRSREISVLQRARVCVTILSYNGGMQCVSRLKMHAAEFKSETSNIGAWLSASQLNARDRAQITLFPDNFARLSARTGVRHRGA